MNKPLSGLLIYLIYRRIMPMAADCFQNFADPLETALFA